MQDTPVTLMEQPIVRFSSDMKAGGWPECEPDVWLCSIHCREVTIGPGPPWVKSCGCPVDMPMVRMMTREFNERYARGIP